MATPPPPLSVPNSLRFAIAMLGSLLVTGGGSVANASCPAYSTCSTGSGNVCWLADSDTDIVCWLTIGSTPPYGDGWAKAVYGNCGGDDYCIWGATEAGANFCCSYDGSIIDRIEVNGGPGDDTIEFHDGDFDLENSGDVDVLEGIADGNGGDDTVAGSRHVGSDYADKLHGGTGYDEIDGLDGSDFIYGEEDSDTLLGGSQNDTISGGTGSDTIRGQAGDDTIHGDDHQDLISGGSGSDTLYGDGDGDVICANSGGTSGNHEEIYGGSGTSNNMWGDGSYTDILGDSVDYDYCGNEGGGGSKTNCDALLTSIPGSCPAP